MSYVVSAASKLHEGQIAAATKLQSFVVEAAQRIAILRHNVPALPDRFAAPLQKATAPLARVVGTPTELGALLRKNARDWVELQIESQAALVGALSPDDRTEQAATLHAV